MATPTKGRLNARVDAPDLPRGAGAKAADVSPVRTQIQCLPQLASQTRPRCASIPRMSPAPEHAVRPADAPDKTLVAHEALAAILESLGTAPNFRESIRESIFALHLWTQARAAAIFRLNPTEESLELIHSVGFSSSAVGAIRYAPVRNSLAGKAIQSCTVITVSEIAAEAGISELVRGELVRQGAKRLLAVPLLLHGRAVGVLNLVWNDEVEVSQHDEQSLMQLGYGLAVAVDHDQRHYESTRDGLTGLFNRREFDFRLHQQVETSRRDGSALILALMDIDDFKHCNDQYGHLAGDLALKALAKDIGQARRRGDLAFRYGGEEFAIVMPECSLSTAGAVAEALRRAFHARQFGDTESKQFRLSVSIGITQYDNIVNEPLISFVERADSAMYRAKSAGKNCVQVVQLGISK